MPRIVPLAMAVAAAGILFSSIPANAETRAISMHNMNTGEDISVVFKKDGRYIPEALDRLNWFLRDWRKDSATKMDSRLFDVVWEVYQRSGATAPIQVHSGFRSRATNAMLRTKTSGVARHSQHINGKALDFHVPGVPVARLRDIAMKMQDGGVGYYPSARHPFVHVDVAEVRHWPPMSRSQLAALFPSGMTAHVPADGRPLNGFGEALKAIAVRGAQPLKRVSRTVASLLPDHIPLPAWRPPGRDMGNYRDLAREPSGGATESAFVPSGLPATASAFALLLSQPEGKPTSFDAQSGMPPAARTDDGRAAPDFVNLGVSGKGPRVLKATKPEKVPVRWMIGGYL